ncbi:MAG: DASS family sodium-coupled anion symporter [Planctomycetaceae bacterium]
MSDTRAAAERRLGTGGYAPRRAALKAALSLLVALAAAFLPEHDGLGEGGRRALFVLVLAAGLWVTEALAAFAVGLLVIALQIALLGRPTGASAPAVTDWERFVRPWASPVIWLFIAGFVMAEAASITGLDRRLAARLLSWTGGRPPMVLLGTMLTAFTLSMFLSNTATTALLLAAVAPVLASIGERDPFGKALLLGVPLAAARGGAAKGPPHNAIAAGELARAGHAVGFARWMLLGAPPALLLLGLVWLFLLRRHPAHTTGVALPPPPPSLGVPARRRRIVSAVFFLTVGLWMTGGWHGIPVAVTSFLPICAYSISGILGSRDVRRLPWDVLLLVAGGLSLGVGVQETGLARWLVDRLPLGGLEPAILTLVFAAAACLLSNFMSNTAAANIFIPLALAAAPGDAASAVVPVALAASLALCLPVSTPPNALAIATGRLQAGDLLAGGLLVAAIGCPLAVWWCRVVG